MANPRQMHTNAADSAPGVNDGPVRGRGAPVDSKPGGRKVIWLLAALAVVVLAVLLLARPATQDNPGEPATSTAPTDISETSAAPQPSAP